MMMGRQRDIELVGSLGMRRALFGGLLVLVFVKAGMAPQAYGRDTIAVYRGYFPEWRFCSTPSQTFFGAFLS